MEEKLFHELSNKEQNKIRKEYKDTCYNSYIYSIRLYILYSILGAFVLIGLGILLFKDVMLGSLIFTISLIFMFITLYFLYLSNDQFYRFLKRKGFK